MLKKKLSTDAVTGIILSGGKSNRFQMMHQPLQDKALLVVSGEESLLIRMINMLTKSCSEIIVM